MVSLSAHARDALATTAKPSPRDEREAILDCLAAFIGQRSKIERGNYYYDWRDTDGLAAFRQDQNAIASDGRDARRLLAFCRLFSVSADHLKSAFKSAFSGRLSWEGNQLDYCTGQNFSVEYRAAACAVLSSAIWRYWREDCHVSDVRAKAKREFGRGLASRWFN